MSRNLLHDERTNRSLSPSYTLENIRRMLNHKVRLSDVERQTAILALTERISSSDKSVIPDDLGWWAGYFNEIELSKPKDTYRFVSVP